MKQTPTGRGLRLVTGFLLGAFFLFGLGVPPVGAQSLFTSLVTGIPLDGIERYIGPIFPRGGIGSTFRSETGTGFGAAQLQAAKLVVQDQNQRSIELNLTTVMPLEKGPHRYDLYTNLRLWRFGGRAVYSNFETRSKAANQGKYDFSGLTLGADVDLVQLEWLTIGVCYDYYFYDPKFQGTILGGEGHQRLPLQQPFTLGLKGDRPSTIGPYIRHVPPEVLGFPLHLEAYLKCPLQGSKLLQYGFNLVFRPQIYRFDLACKIGAEVTHLKFDAEPFFVAQGELPGPIPFPGFPTDKWKLQMEWNIVNVEFVVYF